MFMGALFTIPMLWNRCQWMDNIYTMEFYSVISKNEIMSVAGKWMELVIFVKQNKPDSERQILQVSHMWSLEL
jgi:hypothetical protein